MNASGSRKSATDLPMSEIDSPIHKNACSTND
jgi:hypothetical protein